MEAFAKQLSLLTLVTAITLGGCAGTAGDQAKVDAMEKYAAKLDAAKSLPPLGLKNSVHVYKYAWSSKVRCLSDVAQDGLKANASLKETIDRQAHATELANETETETETLLFQRTVHNLLENLYRTNAKRPELTTPVAEAKYQALENHVQACIASVKAGYNMPVSSAAKTAVSATRESGDVLSDFNLSKLPQLSMLAAFYEFESAYYAQFNSYTMAQVNYVNLMEHVFRTLVRAARIYSIGAPAPDSAYWLTQLAQFEQLKENAMHELTAHKALYWVVAKRAESEQQRAELKAAWDKDHQALKQFLTTSTRAFENDYKELLSVMAKPDPDQDEVTTLVTSLTGHFTSTVNAREEFRKAYLISILDMVKEAQQLAKHAS